MKKKLQTLPATKEQAEILSKRYPIGTQCRYWPGIREGPGMYSRIRSDFWLMGGHTIVVMVEGYAGGIAATHVDCVQ